LLLFELKTKILPQFTIKNVMHAFPVTSHYSGVGGCIS